MEDEKKTYLMIGGIRLANIVVIASLYSLIYNLLASVNKSSCLDTRYPLVVLRLLCPA